MPELKRVPPLTYLRHNVSMPGENFVAQWTTLSEKDKEDLKRWADEEQDALGIPRA